MFQKRATMANYFPLPLLHTHIHTHIRLEYNYTLFRGFILSVISMSSRSTGRKYDAPQRDGGKRRNRKVLIPITLRTGTERENSMMRASIFSRRELSLDFSLEINGIPISHRSRRSKLRQSCDQRLLRLE